MAEVPEDFSTKINLLVTTTVTEKKELEDGLFT